MIDWLKNIKAVGFDLDQTLLDEKFFLFNRWKKVLQPYQSLAPGLLENFWATYEQQGPNYKFQPKDQVIISILRQYNLPVHWQKEWWEKFLVSQEVEERLISGAKELLIYLQKQGLTLGLLTDGLATYQMPRLEKTGIKSFFSFLIFGDHYKKPGQQLFQEALEKITPWSAKNFLYIGDHWEKDIQGALESGAHACWISRQTPPTPHSRLLVTKSLIVLKKLFQNHESI